MKKLNPKIIEYLAQELDISPKTVEKNVYSQVKNNPSLTKNAIAQIYAQKKGLTVFRKLDSEDKASLPRTEVTPEKIKIRQANPKRRLEILINYDTDDYFKKGHIDELNKAYTYSCYTSVFILARKIVENLIIDILRVKFPENKEENIELYFDVNQKRYKDFSVILKNLYSKKNEFGGDNKAVERLCNLSGQFKKNANDKTHSWFHLVKSKSEINNLNIEAIIEIIKKLEKLIGIRKST